MAIRTATRRVASNVRAEMARRNHTQQSLAQAVGKTQQSLSRRLSGRTSFTIDELADIAVALNVNLASLVEVTE